MFSPSFSGCFEGQSDEFFHGQSGAIFELDGFEVFFGGDFGQAELDEGFEGDFFVGGDGQAGAEWLATHGHGVGGIHTAYFVFEFEDESLGGFGSYAFDSLDDTEIAADDGGFDLFDGERGEEHQTGSRSHTGDGGQEQEHFFLIFSPKPKQRMCIFFHMQVCKKPARLSDVGEQREGAQRDTQFVADALHVYHGDGRIFVGQYAFEIVIHG